MTAAHVEPQPAERHLSLAPPYDHAAARREAARRRLLASRWIGDVTRATTVRDGAARQLARHIVEHHDRDDLYRLSTAAAMLDLQCSIQTVWRAKRKLIEVGLLVQVQRGQRRTSVSKVRLVGAV